MDLLARKMQELSYRARDVTLSVLVDAMGGLGTEAISLRDAIQRYVLTNRICNSLKVKLDLIQKIVYKYAQTKSW